MSSAVEPVEPHTEYPNVSSPWRNAMNASQTGRRMRVNPYPMRRRPTSFSITRKSVLYLIRCLRRFQSEPPRICIRGYRLHFTLSHLITSLPVPLDRTMPYIPQPDRPQYDQLIKDLARLLAQQPAEKRKGHANYVITQILRAAWVPGPGAESYSSYADIIGTLECAKLE